MPFHNPDVGKNNPLTKSMYVDSYPGTIIAPGGSKFIVTEDSKRITTEDNVYLITEN